MPMNSSLAWPSSCFVMPRQALRQRRAREEAAEAMPDVGPLSEPFEECGRNCAFEMSVLGPVVLSAVVIGRGLPCGYRSSFVSWVSVAVHTVVIGRGLARGYRSGFGSWLSVVIWLVVIGRVLARGYRSRFAMPHEFFPGFVMPQRVLRRRRAQDEAADAVPLAVWAVDADESILPGPQLRLRGLRRTSQRVLRRARWRSPAARFPGCADNDH